MWRLGVAALMCAVTFSAYAGEPKVRPGDAAPDVGGKDETGADLKLSSFKGKTGVVLFFFPKADTPG